MDAFTFHFKSPRVVHGRGTIDKVPSEVARINARSPILLSTPSSPEPTQLLIKLLNEAGITPAGVYSDAAMHTPTTTTLEALQFLQSRAADCIISLGGGSATGLGKALAVRTSLPFICIPTTYSGSEMTAILGETKDGEKVTYSNPKAMPTTVVYDGDLVSSLPAEICVTSGVNAMAHAVEALYAQEANPILSLLALEGIKALAEALPKIVRDPSSSSSARNRALYGAWLCGICLANSNMGLHHKLCHMLGGSFGLPHAQTHTILLPHCLAYNMPAIPEQAARLTSVVPGASGDVVRDLDAFLRALRAPAALQDFGFRESDLDAAVEKAMTAQYPNPRPLEAQGLRTLLRNAWAGFPASPDLQ